MITIKTTVVDAVGEDGQLQHIPSYTLNIEHSLISISKWEGKSHKSYFATFTDKNAKPTGEDLYSYIQDMIIGTVPNNFAPNCLSVENMVEIQAYMNNPMTATTINFKEDPNKHGGKKEVMTSELIYYYMFTLQIPMECEKWHINRLMMLINVFGVKNDTSKMSKTATAARHRSLNKARRKH